VSQGLTVNGIVVLFAVGITAVTDIWKFKVYNVLTIPLLISGLVYNAYAHGSAGLVASLIGALFGFGILILFYVMGGMGAGDVKLMAAVGAWLGLPQIYYVFIASSFAAGLYALYLVLTHRKFAETWLNLKLLWYRVSAFGRHLGAEDRVEIAVRRADREGRLIPFAAMVAIGVLTTFVWCRLKQQP
jgi:prepilin peptidase CpaA